MDEFTEINEESFIIIAQQHISAMRKISVLFSNLYENLRNQDNRMNILSIIEDYVKGLHTLLRLLPMSGECVFSNNPKHRVPVDHKVLDRSSVICLLRCQFEKAIQCLFVYDSTIPSDFRGYYLDHSYFISLSKYYRCLSQNDGFSVSEISKFQQDLKAATEKKEENLKNLITTTHFTSLRENAQKLVKNGKYILNYNNEGGYLRDLMTEYRIFSDYRMFKTISNSFVHFEPFCYCHNLNDSSLETFLRLALPAIRMNWFASSMLFERLVSYYNLFSIVPIEHRALTLNAVVQLHQRT